MQVFVCDDCEDRHREAKRIELPLGTFSTDPAGGPSTEDFKVVDLCVICALRRLKKTTALMLENRRT